MAQATASGSPSWTQSSDNALLARICHNLDRVAVPPIEFMTLRPARDATDELRRRVGRATKAAFKGLLLDAADLEQRFDLNDNRSFPASSPSTFGFGGDSVRLRLGVSNIAPTVKMHYPLGGGALGLSISALGQVSLDFRRARFARSWLHAGYSRTRGTCELLWRSSF